MLSSELDVLSRRQVGPGLTEVIYRSESGDQRIGRIFRSGPDQLRDAGLVLRALNSLEAPAIIVPDRLENLKDNCSLLSMPISRAIPYEGPPLGLPDLIEPILELHASGWLQPDLRQESFVNWNGGIRLVCWGDDFLSTTNGGEHTGFELPPDPLDDIRKMADMLRRRRGTLWDGEMHEEVNGLASTSRRRALNGLRAVGRDFAGMYSCPEPPPGSPALGKVTLIHGGSWRDRDTVVQSWAGDMEYAGAIIRCIRCRPAEQNRPLPGILPLGEIKVDTVSSLLDRLYPPMGDVRRMLVVNDAEYASPDLLALLSELGRFLPEDFSMVLSASKLVVIGTTDLTFELPGESTAAEDRNLHEFDPQQLSGGFPFTSSSGIGYRYGAGLLPTAEERLDAEGLLAEGAYRVIIDTYSEDPSEELRTAVVESLIRLNRPAEALDVAPEGALHLRARALLDMGESQAAGDLLKGIYNPGEGELHLLAEAMTDMGELEAAASLLSDPIGTDAVILYARVLDLMGRAGEALSSVTNALKHTERPESVPLLCTQTNILMRMGDYKFALASADSAVETATYLGDSTLISIALRERGRVREVLGHWSEAIGDYRLSKVCGRVGSADGDRCLVDLYVLELRSGDLSSADATLSSLHGTGIRSDPSPHQMFEMLSAYRGVLLGLGELAIPAARRAVALAAEKGLNLRHALSLLYLGRLTAMTGDVAEALRILNLARARAGLIGDRHLMLLVDLALASIGAFRDTDRLMVEADELGLPLETLEARIQVGDDRENVDEVLGELLDLPAPFKAMELLTRIKLRPTAPVLGRIRRFFDGICGSLEGLELSVFRDRFASAMILEVDAGEPGIRDIREGIDAIAAHLRRGKVDNLEGLAEALGLDCISTEAANRPSEERISKDPDIYASGANMAVARILAPLIGRLIDMQAQPSLGETTGHALFPEIVGVSQEVGNLKEKMLRTAVLNLPVLLVGETGTGKELAARGLHEMSTRSSGPFIPVDCGAISASLLESELFGAARGAYTGSRSDRKGLFEAAAGGTLFLDEIGNMQSDLQAKLLRVLESGMVRRVGETVERPIDLRLICAINRDPQPDGTGAGLRSDLFYRISVVMLRLPPLRERSGDIPLLARHFARTTLPDDSPCFTRGAMRKLVTYHWPGNVRELRNVVQRAILFRAGAEVTTEDIDFWEVSRAARRDGSLSLVSCMANHVKSVVEACGGNRSEAARVLECDPKTVRKYLSVGEDED